ncbi:hypothetical protein [Nocardioides sp. SYSU DS0651]
MLVLALVIGLWMVAATAVTVALSHAARCHGSAGFEVERELQLQP